MQGMSVSIKEPCTADTILWSKILCLPRPRQRIFEFCAPPWHFVRGHGSDDGLEAKGQGCDRGWRRRGRDPGCEGFGSYEEGDEAEESPDALRAVRARGKEALEVQGVRCLSARSSAREVQGVRWGINLRARSSTLSVQGVRWGCNLRARSSALSVQGVRWVCILRARSSAHSVQGVRWGINLRARSSAL